MFWVVQENVRDEKAYSEFLLALEEKKLPHAIVKVVPFSHETIPDVNPVDPVICWGSVSMDDVARRKGWKPGTFLNENNDQRVWTEAYGEHMLNSDVEYYEFGKIPPFEGTKFIRPVEDLKVFSGMVVHSEEVEEWKEAIQRYSDGYIRLRPETVIGVSGVKDIMMEWRFFVVDGRVVTGSRYRQWGLSDQRRVCNVSEPWKFAQKMVDRWQPAQAFVLDVAQLAKTEEFKVIEVNCINSAGFYECDMWALVGAVETMWSKIS